MKVVKKSKLHFEDGYLLDKKNRVVNSFDLVNAVNEFKSLTDICIFISKNIEAIEDTMEPLTCHIGEEPRFKFEAETKAIDLQTELIEQMFKEVNTTEVVDEMNEAIERTYSTLFSFVSDESYLIPNHPCSDKMLLDPLSLSKENVENVLRAAIDYKSEGYFDAIDIVK